MPFKRIAGVKLAGRALLPAAAAAVLLGCVEARGERGTEAARQLDVELLLTSADDLVIGKAVGVLGDETGRVFIADAQLQTIHVLDTSGRPTGTIGRRGDGPGEFRNLAAIAWLGDTIVALDASSRRLELFDSAGQHVASWSWPQPPGQHSLYVPSYPAMLLGGGGRVVTRGRPVFLPDDTAGVPPTRRPTEYYAVLAGDGSAEFQMATDTLPRNRNFDCEAPDGSIAIFQPFFPNTGPWRAFDGDMIAASSPDTEDITFYELGNGIPRSVAVHKHSPIAVTDQLWDSVTQTYRERERALGNLSCDLSSMRPKVVPPVTAIVADNDGRFWREGPADQGYMLDAFTKEGTLIGEADAPARDMAVPFYFRGDRLYVVTKDADGVQRVQVYRVAANLGDGGHGTSHN